MERRNEDPAELEDLFRLDHLTTRMRRHAESLIILSGAAPGRGWRRPVPLLDVVRSAVSEVEDFPRVDVTQIPDVHLTGAAVADLTHLVAELVENATSFSPPHTRVLARGQQVGSGVVVEIEDRGLGMGKEALEEANQRIADVRRIDLLDTEQLGLFVVNRLAHRQGVSVSLQRSAYGGVTAVVLLPEALLEAEPAEQVPAEVASTAGTHARAGQDDRSEDRPRPAQLRAADRQGDAVPFPAQRRAPESEPAGPARPRTPGGSIPVPHTTPAPAAGPARDGGAPSQNGNGNGHGSGRGSGHGMGEGAGKAAADGPAEPLPRRTRQASLAPPLRGRPETPPRFVPRDATASGPSRRSPEQARATMASLRAGWARGRGTGAQRPPEAAPEEHESSEIPPRGDESR
ncbi:ATP-binding protein [Streptomyces sp. RB6PN25]|uniref:histidine kinase n=1 Tax=Streptomyces humicola TaxID=2953240 RepID=A0ABT1PQB2_9ACTN|nr:ATP-binding protein [Streptomyces humicola]MCQ4079858.1 ATP-binding protein [Streptomyces humicola]